MNRLMRNLVMTGVGLVAGATATAGPAMAGTTGTAGSAPGAGVQASADWRHDRVVDYYDTYRQCDWAGDRGEDRGRWDDYDCYRVRYGFHRGDYALSVDYRWGGGHRRWDNNDNNNNDNNNDRGRRHHRDSFRLRLR